MIFVFRLFFTLLFCTEILSLYAASPSATMFVSVTENKQERRGLVTNDIKKQRAFFCAAEAASWTKAQSVLTKGASLLAGFPLYSGIYNGISSYDFATYASLGITAGVVWGIHKGLSYAISRCHKKAKWSYAHRAAHIRDAHSLEDATSFALVWPPESEYKNNLQLQRFHAALAYHVRPRYRSCFWIELPHELHKNVHNGILHDCWGRNVFSAEPMALNFDTLPSLEQCIQNRYVPVQEWVNRAFSEESDAPAPDVAELAGNEFSDEKTLGFYIWGNGHGEHESIALPDGVTKLYRPFHILPDTDFCIKVKRNNTSEYFIVAPYFEGVYANLYGQFHILENTDTDNALVPGKNDIDPPRINPLETIEDYAKFISVKLTFPAPEVYERDVKQQQYHAALHIFLGNIVNWNIRLFTDKDEKIEVNEQQSRVKIRNIIMPFKGILDWDAIEAQFPTPVAALDYIQDAGAGTIVVRDTDDSPKSSIGHALLGATQYEEACKRLGLPEARHIYVPQRVPVACVSVAGIDKKTLWALCYRNGADSNFFHELLTSGYHLVSSTKPTPESYHHIDRFWENNEHSFNLSGKVRPHPLYDTFAEAIALYPWWPLPEQYEHKPEYQKLHCCMQLLLAHHHHRADRIVHIPDPLAENMRIISCDEEISQSLHRTLPSLEKMIPLIAKYLDNKKTEVLWGNFRFPHVNFDWHAIKKHYPTLEKAVAACQERINKRLAINMGNNLSPIISPAYTQADTIGRQLLEKSPQISELGELSLTLNAPRAVQYYVSGYLDSLERYEAREFIRTFWVNSTHCKHAKILWSLIGKRDYSKLCQCLYCLKDIEDYCSGHYVGKQSSRIILDYMVEPYNTISFTDKAYGDIGYQSGSDSDSDDD